MKSNSSLPADAACVKLMQRICGLAILAAALPILLGCAKEPPPQEQVPAALDRLLEPMRERLLLMHEVARRKFNDNAPVSDPEREAAILKELAERGARQHALEPPITRAFFADQIAAARAIQEADLARWKAAGQPPFENVRNLADLRKEIDGLNVRLLDNLAFFLLWQGAPLSPVKANARSFGRRAGELLVGEGIDDAIRELAIRRVRDELQP